MKNILIVGSIAYDHLMTFDGKMKDSFPQAYLDNLSVSFLASTHKGDFGGCAANIAYSLSLLKESPYIYTVVGGRDFEEYRKRFVKNKISAKFVGVDKDSFTAAGYILSDKEQNQIAIFSPGAMSNSSKDIDLKKVSLKFVDIGLISPDIPERMVKMAELFKAKKVPYIFDPGQALPALTRDQLEKMLLGSIGAIFNEYEGNMICKKLETSLYQLSSKVKFLVRTLGSKGCEYYENGDVSKTIPAIKNLKIKDVTGAGDAFRSGFIHGLLKKYSLEKACELGNTAGSFVVETEGPQTHSYTVKQFQSRLKKNFS